MKRKKAIHVILIILLLSVSIVICNNLYNAYFRYTTIVLEKEPDSIISNPSTNLLAIIVDGQLCLYDENGDKREITTPFDVVNAYHLDNYAMVIDKNNNLYFVDYSSDDIIISDIILRDIVCVETNTNYCDAEKERSFMALDRNGEVYVWGNNDEYILGLTKTDYLEEPTKLEYIDDVKKVHLYDRNAIILTNQGQVYQSGLIKYEGDVPLYYDGFTLMDFQDGAIDIHMGFHTFVLYEKDMLCWQSGEYSNRINDEINASCIENNINSLAIGGLFNMGMSEKGDVYIWGNNIIDKAKHKAEDTYIYLPKKVKGIKDADMVYAGGAVGYVKKNTKIYILKK